MRRRFFAKEVVQTSNMDCGVASLKCLLDSFGFNSNYEHLRDICRTDVNGTSIDRLEEVLDEVGFDTWQMVVPKEQIAQADESLFPAIAVVNIGQNIAHFVVIWRRLGRYLQIVDPAQGRYWCRADKFADRQLFIYRDHLPSEHWMSCFDSWDRRAFLNLQRQRLNIDKAAFDSALQNAESDWQVGAKVDAVLRFIARLAEQDDGFKGKTAQTLFTQLLEALKEPKQWFDIIPETFWSCRPAERWYVETQADQDEDASGHVCFSGALLLRVAQGENTLNEPCEQAPETPDKPKSQPLGEAGASALHTLFDFVKTIGSFSPMVVLLSSIVVGVTVAAQAIAFKLLFEFDHLLSPGTARMQVALVIFAIIVAIAAINLPLQLTVQQLARKLEDRFRIALYEKLPRLKDEYFSTRLLSDLIERSHSVAAIENVPAIAVELVQSLSRLLLMFAGLIYLVPADALWLTLFALLCLALPLAAQRLIAQKDLVTRTLAGTLTRHYANALLGLFSVKVHSGEHTVMAQQQQSLTRWAKAANAQRKTTLVMVFFQDLLTYGCAAALIAHNIQSQSTAALNILYIYWLLQLPAATDTLFVLIRQYPAIKNILLRLQEPLNSNEDPIAAFETADKDEPSSAPDSISPHLSYRNAEFTVAGEAVLSELNLDIEPGTHVAIVGQSGAGKSTFIASLLGFAELTDGEVLIDDKPLSPQTIALLRRIASWLDPQVYLFDKSIVDNITYGSGHTGHMGEVLDEADLWPIIEGLPQSIHGECGEAGSKLSGGEGQRIRLARALNKPGVSLALLDEPFRGLDKPTRVQLMNRVRQKWRDKTLLCVIHDVSEALQFDKVLVFEQGRIVEQGEPQSLLAENGVLTQLIDSERKVARQWLDNPNWRRMVVEQGKVRQEANG